LLEQAVELRSQGSGLAGQLDRQLYLSQDLWLAQYHGIQPGGDAKCVARDILIPGGPKHVNGVIEVQGHDEGWVDLASPFGGAHGKNLVNGAGPLGHTEYLGECTQCHGSAGVLTIDGGWTGIGCGDCHAAFFITQQPVGNKCGGFTTVPCVSCVFCH